MSKLNIRKGNYGYSTKIKNTQDGEELSMYMNVQFPKDIEPIDTALQIDVKDFFFSCYLSKDGVKPKIVVMDYEVLEVYSDNLSTQSNASVEQSDDSSEMDIDLDFDADLPF